MTTITKERIELFVKSPLENGLTRGEQMELARIALASLDAETVRYLNKFSGTCVTLEQQPNAADDVAVYIPLYAAPPVPERERIRREHAEWSDKTFGDVGPVCPLKHLSKEALEAAAEPDDLSEWADMQFLLWDAQRRAGITDKQITLAMVDKLAVNKKREWPVPKDGEPRLHIKAQPVSVVPDGLRQALSNAGIAAPESDEMLAATCEKYIQMLVTWVKDRKPFQPAPVVPETLPCSVELKPGLIIGKGCKTETLLSALQRRYDYNAEIDAMTPEERAERDARIEAFKAMLPTPADSYGRSRAPVVPPAIEPDYEVIKAIIPTANPDEYACCIAADMWNACRAAMLQGAEPVSQTYKLPELIEGMEVSIDVSTCDADAGNRYFGTVTEVSELYTAKNGYILLVQDAEPNFDVNGNSPVTPDGYALVPVEPTDEMIAAAMNCEDVLFNSDESFCVQFGNIYEAMLAAAPQK